MGFIGCISLYGLCMVVLVFVPGNCCALAVPVQGAGALMCPLADNRDTVPTGRDTMKTKALSEVFIQGRKDPDYLLSPMPVQLLNGAALQKLNSFSVADALRFFSGLQLKDYGGIGGLKTVNVRSLGTSQSAVFYDGIQLGNAMNGQVDLGKFSLDNIEEVGLYNGQKNTLLQPARGYGAAASIYLQARRPVFASGETMHGDVRVKAGSFGLFDPSVYWQQKIWRGLSATLSTEWVTANGHYPFRYTNGVYDTTARRQNADIHSFRGEASLHQTFGDSSVWSARFYSYRSGRGLPGAILSNVFTNGQRQWDTNLFFQTSYTKRFSKWYALLLHAKYAYDYLRYFDPDYPNTQHYLENVYKQREWYVSAANQYALTRWWDVGLSGDLSWSSMDANVTRFPFPNRQTQLLALGSQWHWQMLVLQGNVLRTLVQEGVKYYTAASRRDEYTPAFSVSWQPFRKADLRVRSFYKRIFRMPTFNELYYTQIGNNALRPEFSTQYDLGLTWSHVLKGLFRSIVVTSDGYYNRVTDKIVALPSNTLFGWSMINLDKVQIRGADVAVQAGWQVGYTGLSTRVNYTFQQAQDYTPGSDGYKKQIPYTPKHSGSFVTTANWKQLSVNYSFIYTGERYSQKANIPENYLEPWYTHDCSASWSWTMYKTVFKFTTEVNNVFNQYYDVVLHFPLPGRNVRFTLAAHF